MVETIIKSFKISRCKTRNVERFNHVEKKGKGGRKKKNGKVFFYHNAISNPADQPYYFSPRETKLLQASLCCTIDKAKGKRRVRERKRGDGEPGDSIG
jgi:hypothetical protein